MKKINLINQEITEPLLEESDFLVFKAKTKNRKQKIFFLIGLIILGIVVSIIILEILSSSTKINPENSKQSVNTLQAIIIPEPTPFLFQELTIPYLKNREYQSEVGELTRYSTGRNYLSYLTSYNSDGLKVNGLLTIPTTKKPEKGYPAIVFVHGYIPPSIYRTESNYASYVDYFSSRGFIVFKIDLRGHDESEGESSGAYYSGDYVIDVLNAYKALQNLDDVDTTKVGLWGHSMAGNVVFRAMVANPEIPKVVIWSGAVYTYEDFSEFGIDDNSYRSPDSDSKRARKRDQLFSTYGRFDLDSWFWQQVPATNYLSETQGEVQLHHAVNDNTVDIAYSRNLMDILDKTTIPHQLFEYPSGGHNITGSSYTQAMQRSVEFYLE